MQGKEFKEKNAQRWAEYELTLNAVEKGETKASGLDVSRLPQMFREICTDLALARHRMYGMPMNEQLNELVIRGHKIIHRRAGGTWEKILRFIVVDFPVAVRKEWRLFWVAILHHWEDFWRSRRNRYNHVRATFRNKATTQMLSFGVIDLFFLTPWLRFCFP